MNWRKHAYLFDNGKFKVKQKLYNAVSIVGYNVETDRFYIDDFDDEDRISLSVNQCQLIARPIEDMTDEECRQVTGIGDMPIKKLREYIKSGSIADITIPLLSIGVLDTSFFSTEDVMFKSKQ